MATAVFPELKISAPRQLEGKVAFVTGASRGIGCAIAKELADRGAMVAMNFRNNVSSAETVRNEIRQNGGECLLFQGDVSDRLQARNLMKDLLDSYHRIDILVNNAGITRDKSIRKMSDEEWCDVIDTNLNSVFFCTTAAIPAMIDQKFGRIVNIASLTAQSGTVGQANYAVSKGGIIAFTKVIALELAKFNITANVISPGFTCTDMTAVIPAEIVEQIKLKIPMKRFGNPEEIAKAAAFLIADGSYITGQQINVNGGLYM
jgi:acetoacetyl-CoA reductase/3-oxoacyl-[acyl-carrier protein] reductase